MTLLYIVPTPIGNLRDITLRALDVLKEVDFILCEDTRRTGLLLKHYQIVGRGGVTPPLQSFHEHTSEIKLQEIIRRLEDGQSAALVSDGGMPLVSDPGFELIHEAIKKGIKFEILPGANAAITAFVASGLATDSFSFFGFLPQKSAARIRTLVKLAEREETLIFYESPFRVLKVLEEMKKTFGDREAAIARELTKKFEEVARGTLSTLAEKFSKRKMLGEFVILVSGKNRKRLFS